MTFDKQSNGRRIGSCNHRMILCNQYAYSARCLRCLGAAEREVDRIGGLGTGSVNRSAGDDARRVRRGSDPVRVGRVSALDRPRPRRE